MSGRDPAMSSLTSRPLKFLAWGALTSGILISVLEAPHIGRISWAWVGLTCLGVLVRRTKAAESNPALLFCLPFLSLLAGLA